MAEKKKGRVRAFLKKHSFIVVFIVALLIAVTNYIVYPLFISRDLGLSDVPVALETIPEGTLITEDMITFVSVSTETLPGGIYLKKEAVTGKYVSQNMTVPENGFFYAECLTDEAGAMGNVYKELKEGELSYTLAVSARYNQNGLLKPGQFVNFYIYSWDDVTDPETDIAKSSPVYGELLEDIRIVSIDALSEDYYVTVAVSEEELKYLQLAEMVTAKNGGSIYPLIDSDSREGLEGSIFYSADACRNWLNEKAEVFEYSDEAKTKKLYERDGDDTSGAAPKAEILTDGGAED